MEPGATGLVLRVTVGIGTLLITTFYQTSLLGSLLLSHNLPNPYNLNSLAADIESGRTKLLMQQPDSPVAVEIHSLAALEPTIERLRHALIKHPPMFEPAEYTFMTRVLNESLSGLHHYEVLLDMLSRMDPNTCATPIDEIHFLPTPEKCFN